MSAYTQAANEMREAGERHNSNLREMAHALREVVRALDPDTRAAANLRLDTAYHRMRRSRAELEQKTLAFLNTTQRWGDVPPLVEDPLYCPGDEALYGDPQ